MWHQRRLVVEYHCSRKFAVCVHLHVESGLWRRIPRLSSCGENPNAGFFLMLPLTIRTSWCLFITSLGIKFPTVFENLRNFSYFAPNPSNREWTTFRSCATMTVKELSSTLKWFFKRVIFWILLYNIRDYVSFSLLLIGMQTCRLQTLLVYYRNPNNLTNLYGIYRFIYSLMH